MSEFRVSTNKIFKLSFQERKSRTYLKQLTKSSQDLENVLLNSFKTKTCLCSSLSQRMLNFLTILANAQTIEQ